MAARLVADQPRELADDLAARRVLAEHQARPPRSRSAAAARSRTACSTTAPRPCSARSRRSTRTPAVLTSVHQAFSGRFGAAAAACERSRSRSAPRSVRRAVCGDSVPDRSCRATSASACSPRRSGCTCSRRRRTASRSSTAYRRRRRCSTSISVPRRSTVIMSFTVATPRRCRNRGRSFRRESAGRARRR